MSPHSEYPEGAEVPYQKGAIFKFPVELLLMCVDYMDHISISRFSRTCKSLTVVLRDILKERAREFAWSPTGPEHDRRIQEGQLLCTDFSYVGKKTFLPLTSPMKIAIDRGRVGALRGFLEAGMSPSLMTPNHLPLLSVALMHQRVDAAKLLLEYGADPCGGFSYWCTTPLHYAVRYSGPSNCMIEPLLNAGAKVESIELFRWLFDHQNPVKHLEQALANGSNFKRILTDYGDLSVLYALSTSDVDLLTVRLGDMILEKWPELLNSCDDRYGTVLQYVLTCPPEPRNAIYFLDRGIDLRGGELQDAISLRRGHEIHGWKANPARIRESDSIRRTIIVKLLAHPQVDLNTASTSYPGKVEKPLIAAFVRADIETARMILEHPAFQPDAEDICVMTDKLSRERPNGANYERQIQGEREVLKMTARRLAMNF